MAEFTSSVQPKIRTSSGAVRYWSMQPWMQLECGGTSLAQKKPLKSLKSISRIPINNPNSRRVVETPFQRYVPRPGEPSSLYTSCALAAARIFLIRFAADTATRGWVSIRSTSASVAARTSVRVLVCDPFVFSMVHIVTNDLLESVPSGTSVPSFTRNRFADQLAPD